MEDEISWEPQGASRSMPRGSFWCDPTVHI